ncbi:hypothetical protein Tco_0309125 [Tanacetum coccineum]
MVRSMMNLTTLPLSFWDYALESTTRILNMVPTKKVDKTPYELWYGKVPNLSYLKGSRAVDLEEIQEEEDTTPSENTSNIPQEMEGFEPPHLSHEEEIPIRRSERTRRAPIHLSLNVEVEEHSLGDLNEPTKYKAAMLDTKSNKWIDAMNAEIQSMMDNMVWVLVDLPPGCKTVRREAAFILGIKIYRDRSKRLVELSQNAYMDKILKRYKMDNSKRSAQTPKGVNRMKNVPYASSVGSIMYAVRCTRPDVAFPQNITSRFQQNPGELYWTAVKNILKYLRYTKDMFLDTFRFERKRTEMEAVWIRKFISGLGIVPTINKPIKMFCDNSAALLIANEPGVQMGAKHYHRSNLLKVHTDDNLAYPFTKALSNRKLTQHARSMGLRPASSFM